MEKKIPGFVDNWVNEILKIFQWFIYIQLQLEKENYYGNHPKILKR